MQDSLKNTPLTPLMKQYHDIKKDYGDTLLFFQVGDFYELFFDDAKKAATFLGITLTARGKNNGDPIPLCGVPVHALDHYLVKLIKGGFRVAVCNQLEEATPGKVVDRGVANVFTPGTLTDTNLLDEKSASYLCSFFTTTTDWALVFVELLTTQIFVTRLPVDSYKIVESELSRFLPDEILLSSEHEKTFSLFFSKLAYCTTVLTDSTDMHAFDAWIKEQFSHEQNAFVKQYRSVTYALGNVYAYLKKNQQYALNQFKTISCYQPDDFLMLDSSTQKNLELVSNNYDNGRAHTLLSIVDQAVTAMGSRMIKKWLVRPLIKRESIIQRQDIVELLVKNPTLAQHLKTLLNTVGDIERIVGRIGLRRASVHDYLLLTTALAVIPSLKNLLSTYSSLGLFQLLGKMIGSFESLHALLTTALNTDATKDWIINSGFDQRLDYVRVMLEERNVTILRLEQQEQEKTGIASLKVRYNQVHGYYIEITKPNLHLVPDYYTRHQTLVGKERFTMPVLKELEIEMMNARKEVETLEEALLDHVKKEVETHAISLRRMAQACAQLDALLGFALCSYNNGYTRPHFNDGNELSINAGRHPVVEHALSHQFIANDTLLDNQQRILIITGPNMGGKSTYLRQVALLSIMAQCGIFIPAMQAQLPLLDRIFTRIGAGDNVAQGKSTFLVEMEETALICSQATAQSLVIFDEVGRGTSTFDGLAIAWAVIEHIHTLGASCLFATHYHELTALPETYSGIKNYYALSKKSASELLLLHKIIPGIADGSFGIEIAQKAQLPGGVIKRAREVLTQLRAKSLKNNVDTAVQVQESHFNNVTSAAKQDIFPVLQRLKEIDYENLSPKKAFDILWDLKPLLQE